MPEHASAEWLLLRLRWLGKLRWLGAAALAILTLSVHFLIGLPLAWGTLLLLSLLIAGYNLVFFAISLYLESRHDSALTFEKLELFADLQIGLDLVFLTLALHFSGGAENPFITFYVLHPIIASILLTRRSAYALATWATLLMLAMTVSEALWPSLHHPVAGFLPAGTWQKPLVISGEVVAVAVAIYVSVCLAGSIVRRLHMREQQLRDARDALEASSREQTRTNRDLQALEERKSRFLSLAAHQLRGPLAATEGCISAACDGYTRDPETQLHLLQRARNRIQGMLQIVRDLLMLAGTHELSETSRYSQVVLGGVVNRVLEQYASFAASRSIDLTIQASNGDLAVMGDEGALVDALGNIVSNAIKYTNDGGHVKVITRMTGNDAICEVIDDGIGIPETERAQLFEDFFRASNARTSGQEGTGLGLSIVKEVIEKHGGSVSVESLANLGTCVRFSVPLAGLSPQQNRTSRPN